MAKTPETAVPPAPPAPEYVFDYDFDLPVSRTPGGRNVEETEETRKLKALPLPNAEGKKASFLVPITVPAEITDPAERTKQFKALCKTVQNRLGGAIKRIRTNAAKIEGATTKPDYSVRMVADDKLGYGIRVWRLADSEVEAAPVPPAPPVTA